MEETENFVCKIVELNQYFDKLDKANKLAIKNKSVSEELNTQGNNLYNKVKHDQTEHRKLISLYTSSIAFAPKDSEDLPKGFSNRSAVLMHLKLYKEALIDIDRALLLSKSNDLKAKLVSRKERCSTLKNKSNDEKFTGKLSEIVPSKILPNASEAATIEYSVKFGRYLKATRDIKPGVVIIAEESYTCFPKENRIYVVCSHCMRFAWNGIPCDTCVFAIFCSQECKKEAWQEYHNIECSIIPSMFYIFKDTITHVMVTLRLIIKAIKKEGFICVMNEIERSNVEKDNVEKLLHNGVLDSNKFRCYYNLESHAQNEEKFLDFDNALMIVTLLLRHTTIIPICNNNLKQIDSADSKLLLTLTKAFMRTRNILSCNTFRYQPFICDCTNINECKVSCEFGNGTLIAATCSLINHSCSPNVGRIFVPKRKIVIYATAAIKQDEPLCDSYGPIFSLKKQSRQEYLKENYHFLCSCRACEENWPKDIGLAIAQDSISTLSVFEIFMKDFASFCPNEKSSPQDIITRLMSQSCYEKSTLDQVLILCNLLYKYFGYRIAYYHCHQFIKCIERSFLRLYGEKILMPKAVC